jgi:anthranilate synthase/indole-3-glycerol phosphate synthase/phosphoribosylanthranilate isomerase
LDLIARYRLDIVQLHGTEPLEWTRHIPVPVMRRFAPSEPGIGARGYHAVPLFDSGSAGGSGQLLDAVAVKAALERDHELRIMLAGGLAPENVAEVIRNVGEDGERIVGVDVSSGVEDVDGQQSLERIREFVKAAKAIR